MPTLDDDGFILTESSAILKYLADKTGSAAYPKGLQERARVNEVMDWFNTQFYREFGYHRVYPQVYPHHLREPEAAQATTLQWGKDQASISLTVLNDNILGGNKYLCGNSITIADYFGSGLTSCGELIGVQLGGYPNVEKWMGKMKALPNWGSVSDVHDGFVASLKEKTFVAIT